MSEISTELFVLGLLLVANGLFSMAEIAIVSARKARLKQLADDGDVGAQAALDIGAQPTRFLSTVQLGISLCGILAGAYGGSTVAGQVAAWLGHFPKIAVSDNQFGHQIPRKYQVAAYLPKRKNSASDCSPSTLVVSRGVRWVHMQSAAPI